MKNLLKLSALAGISFAMIVFGACSGKKDENGKMSGGGSFTATVNGTAYTATGSVSGSGETRVVTLTATDANTATATSTATH